MTIALVQHLGDADFAAASTTTVLTISKTVTSGDTVFVSLGFLISSGTVSGCVDNLGNTYALAEFVVAGANNLNAALYYAPVTVGGSITTITVTHKSATYRAIQASEWSGVGTFVGAAGGTATTATTVTFATNVTIPANGAVFGSATDTSNLATTAGTASGSPSTSISVEHDHKASNQCVTTLYAIAGGSSVSAFTGTGTGTSGAKTGAGGIFNPAASGPASLTATAGDALASLDEIAARVGVFGRYETRP